MGRAQATTPGQPALTELPTAQTQNPTALILLAPAPSGAVGAALGQVPRPATASVRPPPPPPARRGPARAGDVRGTQRPFIPVGTRRDRERSPKSTALARAEWSCPGTSLVLEAWPGVPGVGECPVGWQEAPGAPQGWSPVPAPTREEPQAVCFLLPMGCIPKWKALLGQGTPNTCTQKGCKKGAS